MKIVIPFNWKIIVFLVMVEVCTIPFVAASNTFVVSSALYLSIMGFIVAFAALIFIMKAIEKPIRRYLSKLLGVEITKVTGILYLGLISGFLLMAMFYLQEITYNYTKSDEIVGAVSAFFSVGATLYIYKFVQEVLNYGIKIVTVNKKYIVIFPVKDIIALILLFTIYETIACPVSIIWLPHHEYRFLWGVLAGFLAGFSGGVPLVLICYLTKYKITFNLKEIK